MRKTLLFIFMFVASLATAFADEALFDFTQPTALTPSVTPAPEKSKGVEVQDMTFTNGGVSLSFNLLEGNTNKPLIWTTTQLGYELRAYKYTDIVLTATSAITEITVDGYASSVTVDGAKLDKGVWTGNATTVTLQIPSNAKTQKINSIKVVYAGGGGTIDPTPDPEPQPEPAEKGEVFAESFAAGVGTFSAEDFNLPVGMDQIWKHDSYNDNSYMKASAYVGGKCLESEGWLLSPMVDLSKTTANELTFENAANFFKGTTETSCTFMIKAENEMWQSLPIVDLPEGNSWNWFTSTVDLSAFDGKKVEFAFVYKSTASVAGTWEIKNVKVLGAGAEIPVEVAVPTFVTETTAFRDLINVELKAEEGLQIHYTTDGNVATAESELYSNPIALIGTSTINAVAVDAQGNVSENVKKTYNLVEAPVAAEGAVVFDFFTNEWNLPVSNQENSVAVEEIKKDDMTLTLMAPPSTPDASYTVINRLWYDSRNGIQLRVYKDAVLKFTAPEGKKIQKITFNAPKFYLSSGIGEFDGTVWNGPSFANIVAFNVTKTTNINSIVVEYVAEETGIEGVEADQNVEKVIFSIDGRCLQAPVQGVNIINGHKVIVK